MEADSSSRSLKDKPFALLGVEKEKLNWRSWSSRTVAEKWSARGTPAYYLLDPKGVIRFKWIGYPGATTTDAAMEKLLVEAEKQ